MKNLLLFLCMGTAAAQVTYQDLLKPSASNWVSYSGTYNSQRHSALTQIHAGNVKSLIAKWIFHVPGANRLEAVPLVVDGVMYISQPNEVYAIDAHAGRLIWEYHHEPALDKGPNRGVSVYGNRVYLGTPSAELVALDSRSGMILVIQDRFGVGEGLPFVGWDGELTKADPVQKASAK